METRRSGVVTWHCVRTFIMATHEIDSIPDNVLSVGHNLGVKLPLMRIKIHQILVALRAPDRQFPESYRKFVFQYSFVYICQLN